MIRIIYIVNILIAGIGGLLSIYSERLSAKIIFEQAYSSHPALRMIGALWLGVAILSLLGLWLPKKMSPVLLFQLLYKAMWLFFVALPHFLHPEKGIEPLSLTIFFVVWVIILPFFIPWKFLFSKGLEKE